jgi:hypothetical protein
MAAGTNASFGHGRSRPATVPRRNLREESMGDGAHQAFGRLQADGREARRRYERALGKTYRRDRLARVLPEVALDPLYPFLGLKPEYLRDDPVTTRAILRLLGHRLHRLVRARAAGEPWATALPPIHLWSLRAALFGEVTIYRRQRAAQAQLQALGHLTRIFGEAAGGSGGRAARRAFPSPPSLVGEERAPLTAPHPGRRGRIRPARRR